MCHLKHASDDDEHEAKVKAALKSISRLVFAQRMSIDKNLNCSGDPQKNSRAKSTGSHKKKFVVCLE